MKMKLLVIILSVVSLTSSWPDLLLLQNPLKEILSGRSADLGVVETQLEIGELPPAYPDLPKSDVVASENAAKLAELLRRNFLTGMLSLPPLDPYQMPTLDPIPVNVLEPIISGTLNIRNVVGTGAKDFNLLKLRLRLFNRPNYRADFNVSLPAFEVKADFTANLLRDCIIPLDLRGKINLQMQELSLWGAVGAVAQSLPDAGSKKQVIRVNSLLVFGRAHHVKVKVDLDNLILRIFENNEVLLSVLYKFISDDIANGIGRAALDQVNAMLGEYSVEEVETFLRGDLNILLSI